jgi:hypothetical protein
VKNAAKPMVRLVPVRRATVGRRLHLDKTEPLRSEHEEEQESIKRIRKVMEMIDRVRARSKARREAQIGGEIIGGMASGLVFNEETYAKAKPLFLAALADFKAPSKHSRGDARHRGNGVRQVRRRRRAQHETLCGTFHRGHCRQAHYPPTGAPSGGCN